MEIDNEWNDFIINNNPDFIFSIDKSGRYTNVNNTLCHAMNLNEDEIIGKAYTEVGFSEELTKQWQQLIAEVYKTKSAVESTTLMTKPDGNESFYRVILQPLRNKDENIIGIGIIVRDITIHQKAKDKLESSKEDFFKMVDNAPDIIAVHTGGKISFINKKGLELIKASTSEEVIGKPVMQFVHKDYVDSVKTRIKKTEKDHVSLPYAEEKFICLDGSFIDVEVKGIPIKFDNKNSVLLIARDITEQKRTETILAESNARLKILIESIPYIVMFKDGNGRWVETNRLAKKRYNLHNIDWFGKTDDELMALQPEFAKLHQRIKEYDEKAWTLKNTFVFEATGELNDGSTYFHEITKVPLFETNGDRKGLLTIVKDTTKRKLEVEHLKLLETAITNTTDAIVITEANTIELPGPTIIFVNDAYLKMTGYKREEILGKNPRILQGINTDRNELKRLRNALENNLPCRVELINYKKNGEEFWSSVAISPVKNHEGVTTHWIAIKRDITENKKYEQNIKKATIQAQENEKYFIGRELHDNIAQILVGSLFSLSTVKGNTDKDNARLKDAIEDIRNSIDEIRNLSHQLAPSKFKSDNFILSIQQLVKSINKGNNFKVITHFDKIDDANLDSDRQLNLYRILQEQLQNIIKHADASEIQISMRFNDMLELRIFDNGKGFDPKSKTNGIGLQNIRNRAEIYGGYCEIKSSYQSGCELMVKLPIT
ncbi:MAG: PAS domain S-box protein [Bacteroidota bacterium]|nr:PAS domain S-box protein [Bacteroidota bacterium]